MADDELHYVDENSDTDELGTDLIAERFDDDGTED